MATVDKKVEVLAAALGKLEKLVAARRYPDAVAVARDVSPPKGNGIAGAGWARYFYIFGQSLLGVGNLAEARAKAEKALEIYKSLKDAKGTSYSQTLLGFIWTRLADFKVAEEHLLAALESFREERDWFGLARAAGELARVQSLRGFCFKAIERTEEAIGFCESSKNFEYQNLLKGNLGYYYALLGDWKKSEAYLLPNTEVTRKSGDTLNLARGLLALGFAHLVGAQTGPAQTVFAESLECIERAKAATELRIYHEYMGQLYIGERDFSKAYEHLKRALELGQEQTPYGPIMTQTWRLLGDLYNGMGEPSKALEAYDSCESYLIKLPEELERGACLIGRGGASARLDKPDSARDYFEKALEVFGRCENEWEAAKTMVLAAESGAHSAESVKGRLLAAKGLFQKLDHPDWEKRVDRLLSRFGVETVSAAPLPSLKNRS